MKALATLATGELRRYTQMDPDSVMERDFEEHVRYALNFLFSNYKCINFKGDFYLENSYKVADLALVANDFSHWFVIEVELSCHSFDHHVLPQVRTFAWGKPGKQCATHLSEGLSVPLNNAKTLLEFIPFSVVVIANRRIPDWEKALKTIEVQFLSIDVFQGEGSDYAYGVEGSLYVVSENIGFGRFYPVERAIRFAGSCKIPLGRIQIQDPSGTISTWCSERADGNIILTKEFGRPTLPDIPHIQLIKTASGSFALKQP